jgi:hypothetical protein
LEAYEIIVLEYHAFVDDRSKKFQMGVSDTNLFRKRIEKKRKFYDDLLVQLESINMSASCDPERQKRLDKKYAEIYDSLLLRVSPNYVAESYLKALMNHDFDRAKVFSNSNDYDNLDMLKELKVDLGLTEIKEVDCIVNDDNASCTFCCTKDTNWKEVRLKFNNGYWFIQPSKDEVPPPEEQQTQ